MLNKNDFKAYSCIALLGGTFNPVHKGHIAMAECALRQKKDIEKLVFMPNAKTYYKDGSGVVSGDLRLRMLDAAVGGNPAFDVTDIEVRRGGYTLTVDTLNELKNINPNLKIYFIIGADSLFYFDKWVRYEEILELSNVLVASRESSREELEQKRDDIVKKSGLNSIELLDFEEVDASSTAIRAMIKQGENPGDMLPDGVYDIIMENGLYR
ncbi:MAG: nicotinate-nucleotide adenylyltransferase [Lachnospiraceae bacterium]|nr:nicotinate-nucleotide adenylyltransferase [Lachnospiraceae bacterium]